VLARCSSRANASKRLPMTCAMTAHANTARRQNAMRVELVLPRGQSEIGPTAAAMAVTQQLGDAGLGSRHQVGRGRGLCTHLAVEPGRAR
jgi:hypothetical protein